MTPLPLLMPREVDRLLRYPRGRSLRLAKAGKLPYVELPDGEVRFAVADIARLMAGGDATQLDRADTSAEQIECPPVA